MHKARAFERRWVCLFTQPHRERLAFSSLREAGCDAYLPLYRKHVFRHGKRVDMRAPLFSRYIFAACREEEALFAASRLKGITSFAARTLEQSRISDSIIQSFRARHDEDGLVSSDPWHLQSGQSVKVLAGPFAGFEAVFKEPDDRKRSIILMNLLGKDHSISVPNNILEVAV